jgi:hypothetical protein
MNSRFVLKLLAAVFCTGITAIILFFILLAGGSGHVIYYSNPKNYVDADGLITFLRQSEDGTIALTIKTDTIGLSTALQIIPRNAALACANGFMAEVNVGDKISLISAPAYFGDGYILPVVGFTKGNKEYLDFSSGISNQIAYEKSALFSMIKLLIIPGSLALYFWTSLFLQESARKKSIVPAPISHYEHNPKI